MKKGCGDSGGEEKKKRAGHPQGASAARGRRNRRRASLRTKPRQARGGELRVKREDQGERRTDLMRRKKRSQQKK